MNSQNNLFADVSTTIIIQNYDYNNAGEKYTLYHDQGTDDNGATVDIRRATVSGRNDISLQPNVTILSQVSYGDKTYTVTSIGERAFSGCGGLTNVTIPNSVTEIRNYAFEGCSSLGSITIPEGVESIGERAFSGCSSLVSVTIPNSVTEIGDSAFSGCSSLGSVTIPEGVTSIRGMVFSGCSNLGSVTIPNSVNSIGERVFERCENLKLVVVMNGEINFPDDAFGYVYSIWRNYPYYTVKFQDNEGKTVMTQLVFTNQDSQGNEKPKTAADPATCDHNLGSIWYNGRNIFDFDTEIQDDLILTVSEKCIVTFKKDATTVLEKQMVAPNQKATKPKNLATEDDKVFAGWHLVQEGGTLAKEPFDFDTKLSDSITLQARFVEPIIDGEDAYTHIEGNVKYYIYDIGTEGKPNYVARVVGYESEGLPDNWDLVIPEKVTSKISGSEQNYKVIEIGERAFSGCGGLTNVTIPNSVTSIGNNAFDWCSITSITIPGSVTSMGKAVFANCKSLTSVTLQDGVTSIGDGAFRDCSSLKLVVVNGDYTLVYNWEGYTYKTVKFQDSEETTVMTQLVFTDNRTTAADPKEYGIVVMGEGNFWSADGTNAFDFGTTITTDYTLKATGSIGYVVTFDPAGGSPVPESQTVAPGEKATKPADPTRAGYKFVGWFKGEEEFDFSTTITGPITLTAKWNLITYKIVEFNLKKSFASGGPQFFAAIGTAAGKQSPSQSIPEFLKSNVAEKMFDVARAASATAEDETQLTRKKDVSTGEQIDLVAESTNLDYYTIKSVIYDSENNSFTVTFNVVVLVGDESGEIRLRENADFAPGLFTVKYDNSTENYCALPYANLKDPSGGDQT